MNAQPEHAPVRAARIGIVAIRVALAAILERVEGADPLDALVRGADVQVVAVRIRRAAERVRPIVHAHAVDARLVGARVRVVAVHGDLAAAVPPHEAVLTEALDARALHAHVSVVARLVRLARNRDRTLRCRGGAGRIRLAAADLAKSILLAAGARATGTHRQSRDQSQTHTEGQTVHEAPPGSKPGVILTKYDARRKDCRHRLLRHRHRHRYRNRNRSRSRSRSLTRNRRAAPFPRGASGAAPRWEWC